MPDSIPPITFTDEPPYAVYCSRNRGGNPCDCVERVFDIEVAIRIGRTQGGWAIRNEDRANDEVNEFGGLTSWQVDAIMAQGWPWTGVSQVTL